MVHNSQKKFQKVSIKKKDTFPHSLVVKRNFCKLYFSNSNLEFEKYIDFSTNRPGEDIRYALDDSKIKKLGWNPKVDFDQELTSIIEYYKTRFIW